MQGQDIRFRCADGFVLPGTWFEVEAPQAVLVVAAAMGVPRKFYGAFAADMAARGIATLTFDYRGIGEAAGVADPRAVRFQDWGRLDLHAALEHAAGRHPGVPLFQIGHSAGGQLAGLTPMSEKLAGLIFIAVPRPHVSQDRGSYRIFSTLWWYVILPLGSLGRWFPARRLGFTSVDIPSGVAAEWGRWARSKRYLFSAEHGIDTRRYAQLRQPALAYSFTDDAYVPAVSAEALLGEYPALSITHRRLRPDDCGQRSIGHLGYFRPALREPLWRETADWVLKAARAAAGEAA